MSWLFFAFPCLLLAVSCIICKFPAIVLGMADVLQYIGQAAYISQNPGSFSNPFFNSVPPGMFYPSLVIAILAAVVASQTMITATFQVGSLAPSLIEEPGGADHCRVQLLSQIIKLSYFPQIKVKHTSKIFHGQIYIPWVNWLLMIGTICVTAAYSNVSNLSTNESRLPPRADLLNV